VIKNLDVLTVFIKMAGIYHSLFDLSIKVKLFTKENNVSIFLSFPKYRYLMSVVGVILKWRNICKVSCLDLDNTRIA
jgi:hypothetical protein